MNWKRWIRPALIATLMVAGIAVFAKHGAVERDLSDRVTQQLSADGLGWASATVSARDVIIRGTAPSIESQDLAVAAAAGINGVRGVQNASDLLPLVSPYVWTAHREGPSVVLSGSVPSEGSRAAVLAAARRALPDAEIRDAMELARGAPASFNSATTIGLTRLATLGAGTVTLTDGTLAVSGTASDAKAYAEAQAATSEPLPAAVNRGPVDILPARADPFVWSVNFDGKSVTMVGFVPNTIVHETLLATTKATLPGIPILDSVAVASGEPPGFAEAASFAIGALERLSQGGVTLDGLNLDIAGTAKSVDDYDVLLNSLEPASLPAGLKAVSAAIAPAVASPYGWQGEKSGAKVVLSGYVPSAAEREDVAATARIMFAGAAIEDQVRVAAGEPRMDWIGAIKFAMGQLGKLERGKVSLGDQTYAIEGEARSAETYAEILDANGKTLPASLELTVGDVTPPRVSPYRFSAERRAGGLVMSGNVASAADRDAIFAAAHRKFGAVEISGDIVFASGEPQGFVEAAGVVLQVLTRLAGGHVEIADKTVTVDGLVYQSGAIEDIADALADSCRKASASLQIRLPPARTISRWQPSNAAICFRRSSRQVASHSTVPRQTSPAIASVSLTVCRPRSLVVPRSPLRSVRIAIRMGRRRAIAIAPRRGRKRLSTSWFQPGSNVSGWRRSAMAKRSPSRTTIPIRQGGQPADRVLRRAAERWVRCSTSCPSTGHS